MGLTIPTLPVDSIHIHPKNIRIDLGDLTDITASIPTVGLLQPLVVAPQMKAEKGDCPACGAVLELTDKGYVPGHVDTAGARCGGSSRHGMNRRRDYTLIAGHRRLAAAKKCALTRVPVVVRADLDTEAKQIEAMLVENGQRKDISAVEEARGIQALMEFPDYTAQRIADVTGYSVRTVKKRLSLTKLDAGISRRVHDGQISLDDAERLAAFVGDPAAMAELTEHIGTPNFRLRVQWLEDAAKRRKTAAVLERNLKANGVNVIPAPDGYPTRSTETQLSALGISSTEHVTCPGHAVVVVSNGSGTRAEPVCTDPAKHGHRTPETTAAPVRIDTGTDEADRAARAAAQREHGEQLAAAAKVRTAFVRELAYPNSSRPEKQTRALISVVARTLLLDLDEYGWPDLLADVLGTGTDDSTDTIRAARHAVDAAHNSDGALVMLLAIAHAYFDPNATARWSETGARWVEQLNALGYTPSDIEQGLLDRVRSVDEQVPA